ncbi:MAG: hypothetical protein ABSD71_14505 [Bacteroidales bacterium]|jgi:hypothetical protein
MKTIFFFLSGALTIVWGIAHLFPTKNVVMNFGDISLNNKRIMTMEWIIEGISLLFIGVLTILIVITDSTLSHSRIVYLTIVILLVTLSIVSLFTGFKVKFLPYRLCPVIFLTQQF